MDCGPGLPKLSCPYTVAICNLSLPVLWGLPWAKTQHFQVTPEIFSVVYVTAWNWDRWETNACSGLPAPFVTGFLTQAPPCICIRNNSACYRSLLSKKVVNSHLQGSSGRSFETSSPSNMPIHPASIPRINCFISEQDLHDTQFFSLLLKSKGVCMTGCWTEQVFQCFTPGKICASSGSYAYSLSKTPKQPQHTPQEQPTCYSMFYIKYKCFTRF